MSNKFNVLWCALKSRPSICRFGMLRLSLVLLLLSSHYFVVAVSAQPNPIQEKIQPKQDGTVKTVASNQGIPIGEQLTAVKGRLADVRKELTEIDLENQSPVNASPIEADEYKTLRERLIQLYELQVRTLEQMQVIDATTDDLRQQIIMWTGFDKPPPYSINLSDDLWREKRNTEQDIRTYRMVLSVFENDLAEAKELLKPAVLSMQQSAEQLNNIKPDDNGARPRWLLELNQLRLRVAEVEVATHETERRIMVSRIAAKEVEQDFLVKKLDAADAHIHFSQQELDDKIEKLDQERLAIQKLLEQAKHEVQSFYLEQIQTQGILGRLSEDSKKSTERASDARAIGEILGQEQSAKLLEIQVETSMMRRRALLEMERIIDKMQSVWKERFVLMNSPGADVLKVTLLSLQTEQTRFDQQRDILLSIQTTIQKKLVYEQSRSKQMDLAAADRELSRSLIEVYRQQTEAWIPIQARMASFGNLLERTMQEAERRRMEQSFMDRVWNLAAMASEAVHLLTDFEIYSITDTITVEGKDISGTRSVTLGQILLFLIIINAGFWLSSRLVSFSQRTIKYLFRLTTDGAALFTRLAQIILAVVIVVAALTTMKIPVTVFAFLGGAMALAIGFGAQNLLNNFVSGLILLIERPVKTGDIVDVEGVTGRITQIGARCCEIRRMDGVEMLVPNSAMIEKTVTNWTLSDQKRRASVTIGIAYGSPVEQTQSLIEAAVRAHPDVLPNPDPLVLFEDFAESAMIFTVYYWLDLAYVADRLIVASEIRVSLNRRLTEAGIIIAYPQRNVHLHTIRPLEVVIGNSAASNAEVESKF